MEPDAFTRGSAIIVMHPFSLARSTEAELDPKKSRKYDKSVQNLNAQFFSKYY